MSDELVLCNLVWVSKGPLLSSTPERAPNPDCGAELVCLSDSQLVLLLGHRQYRDCTADMGWAMFRPVASPVTVMGYVYFLAGETRGQSRVISQQLNCPLLICKRENLLIIHLGLRAHWL